LILQQTYRFAAPRNGEEYRLRHTAGAGGNGDHSSPIRAVGAQ
jgi:hypothetical protein